MFDIGNIHPDRQVNWKERKKLFKQIGLMYAVPLAFFWLFIFQSMGSGDLVRYRWWIEKDGTVAPEVYVEPESELGIITEKARSSIQGTCLVYFINRNTSLLVPDYKLEVISESR